MNSSNNRTILIASWISVVANACLSVLKLIVGFVSGSVSVLGDGVDSATDVLVSVIMVVTARIMRRPPDKNNVYGYEKAESIATQIVAMVIFFAGIQMMITSIKAIVLGNLRELPEVIAIYVTIFSIVCKLALAFYQWRLGKQQQSSMLVANAKNMRNDVLISASVLVGLFFTIYLKLPILDGITGVVVSIFILKTAVEIFVESNSELMDRVVDTSIYDKIFEAVDNVPQAYGAHRVRARLKGNKYLISLDIEVDGDISLLKAHEIAHEVETNLKSKIQNIYDVRIHVEPVGCHNCDEKFGVER